jgi:cell division protein FtsL
MSRTATKRVERKAPARERLKLVKDDRKKVRRRIPWPVVIGLICVFTVIFGVLFARVVLVKTSFKLQKIQENLVAAEEMHEELLLEAAKMESPARIERVARSMGMIDPVTVNYIVADIPQRSQDRFTSVAQINPVPGTDSSVAALGEETP